MTADRGELLQLAVGVAHGQIRRGLSDEIVPLICHPQAFHPLSVFDALVEAVTDDQLGEVTRLLNCLTRAAA